MACVLVWVGWIHVWPWLLDAASTIVQVHPAAMEKVMSPGSVPLHLPSDSAVWTLIHATAQFVVELGVQPDRVHVPLRLSELQTLLIRTRLQPVQIDWAAAGEVRLSIVRHS
jgi:hypothetical protein